MMSFGAYFFNFECLSDIFLVFAWLNLTVYFLAGSIFVT